MLYQPKRVYKKKVSPQCPFCDKRYRNEHSLKKHIAKKHPENAEFVQCLQCFKALSSKEELNSHLCEMVIYYSISACILCIFNFIKIFYINLLTFLYKFCFRNFFKD